MRSDLRLADLERTEVPTRLVNVKVPSNVSEAIDQAASELGVTKTAIVVALLNEGLDAFDAEHRPNVKPNSGAQRPRRGRPPLQPGSDAAAR